MKGILRSTTILSGSSLVSILVGLLAAKGWAVLLGADGMGFMGLLQSLLSLSGLLAGVGLGTGVVRAGANALASGDSVRVAALRRAGWLIAGAMGALALVLLAAFSPMIGEVMLGGSQYAGAVILTGVALVFSLAAGLQTGILNTHHRVGALARLGILNSVLGAGISLGLVWLLGRDGIALGIVAGTATSWAISWLLVRREAPAPVDVKPDAAAVRAAVIELLRFGVPYTASVLVGMGVQMLLPTLVLHTLGETSVGYYRAALTISVTYLGFILTAMTQDYYPRVAAVRDQPGTLAGLINGQHRLVMLLSLPLILGLLALAPYLVPLIYTPQFAPAVDVLEWQLIGDIFKYSSWTMAIVVLARSSSLTYFGTELASGLATLGATWVGVQLFGLAGLGLGFLGSYAIYYGVVWLVVRREVGLKWSRENLLLLGLAVLAALVVRALPFAGLEAWRTPVALLFAVLAGAASLRLLLRELAIRRPAVAEVVV